MNTDLVNQKGIAVKKLLVWLAGSLALLLLIGVVGIRYIGAWNLVFPNQTHETVAPEIPALAPPAILLFTKTNGFRHGDGIEGGTKLVQRIAEKRGWSVFHTENGATFNTSDLNKFAGVIFLNASGDMLSAEQEASFQGWLEAGGGWLGIHAAGDSSHAKWSWYVDNLLGAKFTAHILGPQFQVATVNVENKSHPVSLGLPASWQHEEEWYSWEASPRARGFTILATIDESSYAPVANYFGKQVDLAMGDHPVVWSRCVGQGRAVYSAMGHRAEAFVEAEQYTLLESAIAWIIDRDDVVCRPPDAASGQAILGQKPGVDIQE